MVADVLQIDRVLDSQWSDGVPGGAIDDSVVVSDDDAAVIELHMVVGVKAQDVALDV